jgi:hypothetical protein
MAFTTRTAMTTKRSIKWGLVAAATAFVAVAAMPGCELLVDFDRSKIPQEAGEFDGTTPGDDGTSPEATPAGDGGDAGDGGSCDATSDAPDAPVEGSADAPSEAAAEAGAEGGTADTGVDAPVDTGAGVDAATDSSDDGG